MAEKTIDKKRPAGKTALKRLWKSSRDVRNTMLLSGLMIKMACIPGDTPKQLMPAPSPFQIAVTRTIARYNQDTGRAFRLTPAHFRGNESQRSAWKKTAATLEQTPQGRAILAGAKKAAPDLHIDSIPPVRHILTGDTLGWTDGWYEPEKASLTVNGTASEGRGKGTFVNTAAHELTHAGQTARGLVNPEGLSLTDRLMQQRLLEADADARMTQNAWEMKEAGNPDPWKRLAGWKDAHLAEAYEKAATRDPENVKNGTAMAATFKAWFTNRNRVRSYDEYLLDDLKTKLLADSTITPASFDGHRKIDTVATHITGRADGTPYMPALKRDIAAGDTLYTKTAGRVKKKTREVRFLATLWNQGLRGKELKSRFEAGRKAAGEGRTPDAPKRRIHHRRGR